MWRVTTHIFVCYNFNNSIENLGLSSSRDYNVPCSRPFELENVGC